LARKLPSKTGKDRNRYWEDEQEDVSSYWIVLIKRENAGNLNEMH
jgi:hypothetical protein